MKVHVFKDNPEFTPWVRGSQIYIRDTADITRSDFEDYCLSPARLIDITWKTGYKDSRKMLNNISDRGYIDFKKDGSAVTAPRMYNLYGAIAFSIIYGSVFYGLSYKAGAKLAQIWIDFISERIDSFDSLHLFTEKNKEKGTIVWSDIDGNYNYQIIDVDNFSFKDFDKEKDLFHFSFYKSWLDIDTTISNFALWKYEPDKKIQKKYPYVEELMKRREMNK